MLRSAFSGRRIAALAVGLFFVVAGLGVSPGDARADHSHLRVGRMNGHPDILVMIWTGEITNTMSDEISAAFEQNKNAIKAVEFKLNSPGGSVFQGERVIKVLQDIKKTHKLYTVVDAGKMCASMCVFIYAQGDKRLAASASLWLFHEVSKSDKNSHVIRSLNREAWLRLVDLYLVPAGVNTAWIDEMKTHTVQKDYWQSGEDIMKSNANYIQVALSDERRRVVKPLDGTQSQ